MKKSYIFPAVLLMAALVSCQENEISNGEYIPKEGDVVFSMKGNGRATKSMDSATPVKGMTIDLGTENNTHFFLEETVINLNDLDFGPQTKGTPAYTENLGKLYANDLGVHADKGTFGDFTYESVEANIGDAGNDEKWLYKYTYPTDPWPDNDTPVGFYLHMPASPNGVTLGTQVGGSISFSYVSPETADATQDILFGYRSLAKKDYPKTGIPAVLFHALTGVKFAIGNTDEDITANGIAITEISFSGLLNSGECVINPADIDTSGSEDYNLATWSNTAATEGSTISATDLAIVDYSTSEVFPESFTGAGATKNLNDNDATKTFWLIPQDFTGENEVVLTIKYTFGGANCEWHLPLGEILKSRNTTWKAGELRTYTIKVDEVNLRITDDVTDGTGEKGIVGSVKDNVQIQNTGNVEAFIRAAIVGQWRDTEGNLIFGFTDKITDLYLVESWYEDQFVNKDRSHGEFKNLAGYDHDGNTWNGWVYNPNDGYYYYSESVQPSAFTNSLFESYTVKKIPEAQMGGIPLSSAQMYFTLEIATQAISARTSNGTLVEDYAQAWAIADPSFVEP